MSNSVSGADSTSAPNNNQTEILCRCCEQPMEYTPWEFNGKDMSIITCWDFECGMYSYTFTAKDYDTVDISIYCK